MLEFKINGETYTEKEFQKDIVRMFDSLRTRDYEGESRCCCIYVKCKTCPLRDICIKREGFKYYSFETIEKVYRWAKEHPIVTNIDKLVEMFGFDGICYNFSKNQLKIVYQGISRIFTCDDDDICDISEWFEKEYKEPKKECLNLESLSIIMMILRQNMKFLIQKVSLSFSITQWLTIDQF